MKRWKLLIPVPAILLWLLCGCVDKRTVEFAINQGLKVVAQLDSVGVETAMLVRIDPTGTFFPWGYIGKTEVTIIALGHATKGAKADTVVRDIGFQEARRASPYILTAGSEVNPRDKAELANGAKADNNVVRDDSKR